MPVFFFFFFKIFFIWTVFKSLIEFVTVLLLFYILLFFSQEACEILAPQPGIELVTSALEGEVVTTGQPETIPHPTF